jgi:hypothetical protein
MTNENVALNSCFKEAREQAERKKAKERQYVYVIIPAHDPNRVLRVVFEDMEDAVEYARHQAVALAKYAGELAEYRAVPVVFVRKGQKQEA